MSKISIIIPTLNRSDCLRDCLESIWAQDTKEYPIEYEIIKVTEEGPLASIRNIGARRANGEYLIFIDDDVVCSPEWLFRIWWVFDKMPFTAGVSGPAYISKKYRKNRDIFRFPIAKLFYDMVFCEMKQDLPGHITSWGAWTTGAANEGCNYNGEVDFLEACNMAFRKDAFEEVGGFDEAYKGIGDWSEPDLSFRIREKGYRLVFCSGAALEHRPSKSGAFLKRDKDTPNRLANYDLFASRWIKSSWKSKIYRKFIGLYYEIKTSK